MGPVKSMDTYLGCFSLSGLTLKHQGNILELIFGDRLKPYKEIVYFCNGKGRNNHS